MRPVVTAAISDPGDPRVADYRDLTDAAARRSSEPEHGLFIVEGVLALERLLDSPYPLRSVLLASNRVSSVAHLLDRTAPDVPVLVADRAVLQQLTGFDVHRGVLASAARTASTDVGLLVSASPRVVVAGGVVDNENMGAIFRTAAALGVGAVLLDDLSADPLYRRSIRVSLGHVLTLPHGRIGSLPGGLALLRRSGHRIVALTPGTGALAVDEAARSGLLDDPVALVLGAEGPGLDPGVIAAADVSVRVPMTHGVDSLNVATTLGVVASFAAARRGWDR